MASSALAMPAANARPPHKIGLGKILTSQGGQIYGYDINRNGNDGVLATVGSVEVFDQDTGKITSSFGKTLPHSGYVVDGIAAEDVALVTHDRAPKGQIYAIRHQKLMDPVPAGRFTSGWASPVRDVEINAMSEGQDSQISSEFGYELQNHELPVLIVSNLAANTVDNVVPLGPLFGQPNYPQFAQYTAANQAVIALSPDGGAVGGKAPLNILIDLSSGKQKQFVGYNNGFYHAGTVDGLAVDPNTGVAATTTNLNSQVEFYDLNRQKGINFVQTPCSTNTDELHGGTSIANDPVHHFFLVKVPYYCDGSQGSAVLVYSERGKLLETIAGFRMPTEVVIDPPPRINPGKRMGWVFGGPDGTDGRNDLTQFFY